jgi:predicted DNA-binding transcriptional regulator AlpA
MSPLPESPAGAPGYYTARVLQQHLGIPASTFWRLLKRGLLPQPVRIAPRCVRWVRSEVEAFERQLQEERGRAAHGGGEG